MKIYLLGSVSAASDYRTVHLPGKRISSSESRVVLRERVFQDCEAHTNACKDECVEYANGESVYYSAHCNNAAVEGATCTCGFDYAVNARTSYDKVSDDWNSGYIINTSQSCSKFADNRFKLIKQKEFKQYYTPANVNECGLTCSIYKDCDVFSVGTFGCRLFTLDTLETVEKLDDNYVGFPCNGEGTRVVKREGWSLLLPNIPMGSVDDYTDCDDYLTQCQRSCQKQGYSGYSATCSIGFEDEATCQCVPTLGPNEPWDLFNLISEHVPDSTTELHVDLATKCDHHTSKEQYLDTVEDYIRPQDLLMSLTNSECAAACLADKNCWMFHSRPEGSGSDSEYGNCLLIREDVDEVYSVVTFSSGIHEEVGMLCTDDA